MKRKIISVCILLLGFGIVAYPHVASYLQEKNGSFVSDTYQEKAGALSESELEKLWREAEIYNENLTGTPVHDPFVKGSGIVMANNYYEVLDFEGTMATIEIPSINVKLPIYHGTDEKTLERATGHLEGSTLPIGGSGTHAVITGHTGLSHAKIFTNLVELVKGDQFYVHVLGKALAYAVDQIKVVDPSQTDLLKPEGDQDLVTLLTCTPYGINSHRLLVRGTRVPYDPAVKKAIKPKDTLTDEQRQLILIALVTTIVMSVVIVVSRKLEGRSKKVPNGKNV